MAVKISKGATPQKAKKAPAVEKKEPVVLDAKKRTEALKRLNVSVDDLVPQEHNPNEMSDRQFNLLVDNIQRMGVTDPVLVREHPTMKGKLRIIGGEHRWRAAKMVGLDTIPVTLVPADQFSEDEEKFQIVRHNIIHGKMSPSKFLSLYESLSEKYTAEVAAESFGFAEEEEFRKLIKSTADSLPPEMKTEFKEAAKEVKTIDELAKLLNHLFTTYGDTLPFGYMVFDFGGKESVWIRMQKQVRKNFDTLAHRCREESKALDDVIGEILALAVSKGFSAELTDIYEKADTVALKKDAPAPTLDFLDEYIK